MWANQLLQWIFPTLMILSGVLFYALPGYIQDAIQPLHDRKHQGWTWFNLSSYSQYHEPAKNGYRRASLAIASDGTIWVAGGNAALSGLHYYDGSAWHHKAGDYSDLAVGPNGQVWPAPLHGPEVQVFDGRQWKTYRMRGMDPNLSYPQVEIDSTGRVWYVTDTAADRSWWVDDPSARTWLGRLAITGGALSAGLPVDAPQAGRGWFISIDAGPQGGLWVSVHPSAGGTSSPGAGLFLLDGETWQRIDLPASEPVQKTVFDSQGDPWVLTEGGGVLHYTGGQWKQVIGESSEPALDGLFVDPKGRVWVWAQNKLRFLQDGQFTEITPSNSGAGGGLDNAWLFGVVVDQQDRAWIATDRGVSMAQVQDIHPLSYEQVQEYRAWLSRLHMAQSVWWVIPSVFAFMWLAARLGALPGVWLSAVLGMGSLLFAIIDPRYVTPGLTGLYLAMLSNLLLGMHQQEAELRWPTSLEFRAAISGCLAGWAVGTWLLMLG